MPGDPYDRLKIANQFCDLLDESELPKGADQLRVAGFSEAEIRAMELMICTSDDPKVAEQAIGEYYVERQRQADLQHFIEELPAAYRALEVESLSKETGLRTDVLDSRLQEIENYLGAMANNPFSGRFR
jgi:hypothetical protein